VALEFLINAFQSNSGKEAIIWHGKIYTYDWFLERLKLWSHKLKDQNIKAGMVIAVQADFSPAAISLVLSLIARGCILVPLHNGIAENPQNLFKVAQVEGVYKIQKDDGVEFERLENHADHRLYAGLKSAKRPGLVLFSSGSTGEPKAVLLNLNMILKRFISRRRAYRTIQFLLFDHIGGINTLLYTLANGGCVIRHIRGWHFKFQIRIFPKFVVESWWRGLPNPHRRWYTTCKS
jgi:acyl-CoA synthetase (AMP-forming)/AMP-acid ligase II